MPEVPLIVKGYIIGVMLAFPMGPVGIICVRRMLVDGRKVGLASGFGAATADAVYASLTVLSLGLVSSFLTLESFGLRLAGGIFLIVMGIVMLRSHPVSKTYSIQERGLVHAFFTTFFITLANPAVFFSFAGIMAATGLAHSERTWLDYSMIIGGVFTGSASWWLVLSSFHHFAETLDHANIRILNMITGVVLCCFGLVTIISLY